MHKYFFPLRCIGFSYASEIGVRYGKRRPAVREERRGLKAYAKTCGRIPHVAKERHDLMRGSYATGLGTFAESQSRSMILLHWGVR